MSPRTAHGPAGGNPAPGGFHYRPKMPKSSSDGVGIDRRRPSRSIGPPRLAKNPRHARPRQVHVGVGWIPPLVKAPSNDTRPLADRYKACPNEHRMDITTPHSPPWGPGRRGPTGDRILQGKVRWRHEKDLNRLLRGLVQIGRPLPLDRPTQTRQVPPARASSIVAALCWVDTTPHECAFERYATACRSVQSLA